MKSFTGILSCMCMSLVLAGQGVGIGTQNPDSAAILQIESTSKGVVFPRMTTAQRNAIANPPDGLHVYNTDDACLNYYDALIQSWNCYCNTDTCHIVRIRISQNPDDEIYFLEDLALTYPVNKKFVIIVDSGVTIAGGNDTAVVPPLALLTPTPGIIFNEMPGAEIVLINHGTIIGRGGVGGQGGSGGACEAPAGFGSDGSHGILKAPSVNLTIYNYGLIGAGGGGGGGGGRQTASSQFGGGGGGGAASGIPGNGGGSTTLYLGAFCIVQSLAMPGMPGTTNAGGSGGTGLNGGGTGGAGGGIAEPGQNGTGTNAGIGGFPGKAISGIGAILINLGGGQVIGTVD